MRRFFALLRKLLRTISDPFDSMAATILRQACMYPAGNSDLDNTSSVLDEENTAQSDLWGGILLTGVGSYLRRANGLSCEAPRKRR